MSHKDDEFIRNFSLILGGLVLFAVVLIVFAGVFHDLLTPEVSDARVEAVQDRLQPIGTVYAGTAGAEALATATASTGAATREPMSGQEVYQAVCTVCHSTGAGGSPKLTMAAWAARIAKGEETMISHAINGFQGESGIMPPKGGRTDLSDEEVTKAVKYMLAQIKGK